MGLFTQFFSRLFGIFHSKRTLKLGLYGPPNSGKTTLANKLCKDWTGEELGIASKVPHETREILTKENVVVKHDGKELTLNLVDTPGIATRIDYEDFVKAGLTDAESKTRAKEATKGVIDAIKWLDDMEAVLVILDATRDPYNQVNLTILGNLDARKVPALIVANKIDLRKADVKHVQSAFPQYEVVGISAKTGEGFEEFYEKLFSLGKGKRPAKKQ